MSIWKHRVSALPMEAQRKCTTEVPIEAPWENIMETHKTQWDSHGNPPWKHHGRLGGSTVLTWKPHDSTVEV